MSSSGGGDSPSAVSRTTTSRSSSVFNDGQARESHDLGATVEDFLGSEDDLDEPQESEADERVLERPIRLSEDSSSPEPPWPQKYYGPASTWRSWTAAERAIAMSLDQLKSEDLSAHLYNAHILKSKARRGKSKQAGHSRIGEDVWEPPRHWTAWPMPAGEVPRGKFKPQDREKDEETAWQSRKLPLKPSSELEEALTAVHLKIAKERFLQRPNSQLRQRVHSNMRFNGNETEDTLDDQSEGLKESTDDQDRGRPRDRSWSRDARPLRKGKRLMKPVVMADDDTARTILSPSVRHVLSELDKLLVGLHNTRQSYLNQADSLPIEPQTETESENRVGRSRSRNRSKKPVRQRLPQGSSIQDGDDSDSNSEYNPDTEPDTTTKKKRRASVSSVSSNRISLSRQGKLGHRDWSDIMGIASLTGFSPTAIQAASKRCAALFGEAITFRTLPADITSTPEEFGFSGYNQIGNPKENPGSDRSASTSASDSDPDSDSSSSSEKSESPSKPPAHGKPQSVLSPPSDPKAHTSRLHAKRLARDLRSGKIFAHYCPVATCPRSARGFSRLWNMRQHLRKKHPERGGDEDEDEDEMLGGVHVDGFLRPVRMSRGWRGRGGKGG